MSKARPDLPNDVNSARKYVQWLGNTGLFSRILIHGSRSPLREKQPGEHSDWDLVLVFSGKRCLVQNPKTTKQLFADLVYTTEDVLTKHPKIVEIWPSDIYGVLSDAES